MHLRHILLIVDGLALRLNALHGRGMGHQTLSIHGSVCHTGLAFSIFIEFSSLLLPPLNTHLFLLMPVAASRSLASPSAVSSGSSTSESSASGALSGFRCSLSFSLSATSKLWTPSSSE